MAKIRDYAITINTTATANLVCEMPVHETGDLLLAFLNKDSTTGFAGTGWTMQQEQNSAGAHGAVWAKRATSASETITFTLTSETCLAVVVAVKNVNGSSVADAVSGSAVTGADDLTFPLDGGTITPSHNNCLIFDWLSTDIGIGPSSLPGWINIFTGDAGANSGCLSYTYQKTAAEIIHPGHWGGVTSTAADSRAFIIAIRDDGNESEIDPYVDRTTLGGTIVASILGVTGALDAGTWTSTLSLATVGAKSTSGDIVANVADSGYIPFWGSASFTPTSSTTLLGGSELGLTTATDMQTGSPLLFGTWNFATPRDYVDLGKPSTGGLVIAVADAANDYKAWVIGGQFDKTTNPDKRNKFAIQVNQSTDTTYGSSGTLNDINKILYLAAGVYGAVAWRGSNLWLLTETILAGGSATTPLNFEQMEIAVNDGTGRIPIFDRDGAAAMIWTRLRIGGGDPVHYSIDAKTFQWPRVADAVDYFNFHVDVDAVGIEFYGQASDTIHFTTCTFSSSTSYYWRINSSASSSANWDFAGTTVVGATVTLRPVFTFTSVTFSDCSEIVLNDADLDNCTLKNQRTGNNSSAIAFTSATEGNGVTTCAFVDNHDGDLGHSIRITASGSYDFDGHTFSGGGPAAFSFHTQTDVDPSAETITKTGHGYTDGDAVYYQDQGGSDTVGLTDGNLCYVNAVTADTLSFYDTKANAIAGGSTGRADLSDGSTGQTHYIYSAKADVYNNSGGAVTINILNGGSTPTIRNSNGSSTNVVTSVSIAVHVEDDAGTDIQSAQVFIRKSSDYYNYTSHNTNNSAGDATFEVNEAVDTDLPQAGWIHVWDASSNTKQDYRYTSWSGTIFTLPSEVTGTASSAGDATTLNSTGIGALNIQEGDAIRNTTDGSWAIVDELSTNSATTTALADGSDNTWQSSDGFSVHRLAITYANTDLVDIPLFNGQTDSNGDISTTFGGATPAAITVRIRSNTGATKYVPFSTSGTITSSGYSLTAILTEDTVAT